MELNYKCESCRINKLTLHDWKYGVFCLPCVNNASKVIRQKGLKLTPNMLLTNPELATDRLAYAKYTGGTAPDGTNFAPGTPAWQINQNQNQNFNNLKPKEGLKIAKPLGFEKEVEIGDYIINVEGERG